MPQDAPDSSHLSPQQVASDIEITGNENNVAFVNTSRNASIDQSRHVIYNYYYSREEPCADAVEAVVPDGNLPCPYRGLFHFGPEDAEFFFGRDVFVTELVQAVQYGRQSLVAELVQAVQTRAFIPVLGASGSGKSSVVFAGLVPQLKRLGYWQFTHFRPGADPFHALALALVPLYQPQQDATEQMAQARKLANYLHEGNVLLADVIARIQQNYPNQRVLLIADQFEELYTFCPEETVRQRFLDCLLASLSTVQVRSSPLVLVATMRADFLGNALSYRPFADVLQDGDVKLGAMNREELCEVIERPAAKLGVTFEAGLVKRILDAVVNEPGNLPLLEFALTELWSRRNGRQLTHAAYEAIGEVEGALARYADEHYRHLSAGEQEQVRRIFIQLVRPGEGTEDTRRLATKAELGENRWALVKQLADARLVVTSQAASQQETVEVVHEALIRNWGKLREWIASDRSFRIWQDRLRITVQQWKEMNKDEGGLLRGAALVEAKERLQCRREDLSAEEQDFIQTSVERQRQEAQQQERRRKATLLSLASFSIFALGLASIAGWQWRESDRAKIEAEIASAQAKFTVNRNTFDALLVALQAGEHLQSSIWFSRDPDLRARVLEQLVATTNWVKEQNRLEGHTSFVNRARFSPDDLLIATAGADNTAKIWNLERREHKSLIGHAAAVIDIAFNSHNKQIVTASLDGTIKLWNYDGQQLQSLSGHSGAVLSASFSPDGKWLATGGKDQTVRLWHWNPTTEQFKFAKILGQHNGPVYRVTFSSTGKLLATASGDKTARLWNLSNGQFQTLTGHTAAVRSVCFSPNSTQVATASEDKTVILWDWKQKKRLGTLTSHTSPVTDVSYSPDGQTIATASKDNTVKLWNLADYSLKETLQGHSDRVNSVSFSHNGTILVSASNDTTVKLWNLNSRVVVLGQYSDRVFKLSMSRDGQKIAAASLDSVNIWNSQGKLVQVLPPLKDTYDIDFSPDGKLLALANNQTLNLWDSQTNRIRMIGQHRAGLQSVRFSPDGQEIASAGNDNTVKFWSLPGGKLKSSLNPQQFVISDISFSSKEPLFATSSWDGTVKLWNQDQTLRRSLGKIHDGYIYSVRFSPNGQMLATASQDKTVKLWNQDGSLFKILNGHQQAVENARFRRDEGLATASDDGTIKLWAPDGQLITTLIGHNSVVNAVEFSPNGNFLFSASSDKTVLKWDISNLTLEERLKQGCAWMKSYLSLHPGTQQNICQKTR